ncbi:endonuclease-reverse transcriptase [Biomphalaria glabrata]
MKGSTTTPNSKITICCHSSQSQERLERKVITDYNELLKRKISHAFLGRVAISNILHVFNAYNVHVLNSRDIEEIQKTVDKKGEYKGGEKLLNRLCVYEGWFECLLKVLKDPSVKLSHVARNLETLKAMELRCYRRILGITFKDRITNQIRDRVNAAIGAHDDLLTVVKRRKLKTYGHITRSTGLSQGTVPGERRRGRQKKTMGGQHIKEWTGLPLRKVLNKAKKKREEWRKTVDKSCLAPQRSNRLRDR